jgi:predicted ATP-dependent protease
MTLGTLPPDSLRLRVQAARLGFEHTQTLLHEPLSWIGQDRARQAALFGLRADLSDHNLFVLGEVGTGRSSRMLHMMQAQAAQMPVPPDLCFLHNFDAPQQPCALRLRAGGGRVMRQLMQQWARQLQTQIPKRLSAPDVLAESERIQHSYKAEEDRAFATLSAFANARHFGLIRDQGHLVFTLRDAQGEPLTATQAMAMSPEQRAVCDRDETALRSEISRFLDKNRAMERVMNEGLSALRRQAIGPMIEQDSTRLHQELQGWALDAARLQTYLQQARQDVLDNLSLFQPPETDEDPQLHDEALAEVLARLRVHVAVDHHGQQGAPVIVEDNPVWRSLLGSIEYGSEEGLLVTDFTRIRAGSLMRAHGGFLMLHLHDLLADETVWQKLRRFLRSGRLQIEDPGTVYAPVAAVSLEPEPVDLKVKIVLIGSALQYCEVQALDPEFARRFRCKVEVADSFTASDESWRAMGVFVAHTCEDHQLAHFEAAAVAALIEQSHREAQDQTRQSAVFANTQTLVLESAMTARVRGASRVQAQDVQQALQARRHRHNHLEQRLQETLRDGERLLQVHGHALAQVNGLTVLDLGDSSFGFPVRVTARTYAGEEGLLNIEREVEMSGPIHDKGVLILHSHLSALFAHLSPLALNAAVVFEQEYAGVEGDSASCAEFCALLSSLSGLALRQDTAVTGALDQHGHLLPVGGINEKIEGFFRSCEVLGLNGQQGVLIPRRSQRQLMLDEGVVEAVRTGRFHIHAADTVDEAMSLLTGCVFGQLQAGTYPADTVLGMAQHTLLHYRRACQAVNEAPSKRHGQHRVRGPLATGRD